MIMHFQYWEGIQRSINVKRKISAVKIISQVIAGLTDVMIIATQGVPISLFEFI